MFKNLSPQWKLVLAVLLFSAVLLALAIHAEFSVQGHLNEGNDSSFMAYLPGRYSLYRESIVDSKASIDEVNKDNSLNEIKEVYIRGHAHLDVLTPQIKLAGGMPYCHKDRKSGKYKVGIPFAECEILWPGHYRAHVEFSSALTKHPDITIGPKGFITIAIAISIIAQLIAIYMIIRKKKPL